MDKDFIKNYLIISFVVVELLSMLFNYYFIKIHIGSFEYYFNFSVVFFCLGFFIVDIIADQFSPREARKFIFYKLYSQVLFLILGQLSIGAYGLGDSQIAYAFNKSPWMIASGLLATYVGFHVMSSIMSYMKIGISPRGSIFTRYLYSTIPGELLFSFVFTMLCFYMHTSFDELMHVFITSMIAKVILSVIFALFMQVLVKIRFSQGNRQTETPALKVEAN